MRLELDAGNTRVKWRLVAEQTGPAATIITHGAFVMAENSAAWDFKFCDALGQLQGSTISRMLVSNVRGDGFKNCVIEHARNAWGLVPEFAVSAAYCAGVTNGYVEPEKLGVDRWLAILAAYDLVRADCCILNCGTTVTFDIVKKSGMHMGGYIMPGLRLMKDSLMAKSEALKTRLEQSQNSLPGCDTASAINNGTLMAIVGFATGMRSRTDLLEAGSVWVISGGDGEIVSTHLHWNTRLSPSLVLDGLCLAIP
jgi:type III pantothenate kinase